MAISLRDQVVLVYGLRTGLDIIKGALREARANFDKDNADLIKGLDERTAELAQAEAALRDAAVGAFVLMGARKPCPGVEVKDFTELRYDADEALKWATEHGVALALDKRTFDAFAKSGAVNSLVTIVFTQKATIATDLGKALNEQEHADG